MVAVLISGLETTRKTCVPLLEASMNRTSGEGGRPWLAPGFSRPNGNG